MLHFVAARLRRLAQRLDPIPDVPLPPAADFIGAAIALEAIAADLENRWGIPQNTTRDVSQRVPFPVLMYGVEETFVPYLTAHLLRLALDDPTTHATVGAHLTKATQPNRIN